MQLRCQIWRCGRDVAFTDGSVDLFLRLPFDHRGGGRLHVAQRVSCSTPCRVRRFGRCDSFKDFGCAVVASSPVYRRELGPIVSQSAPLGIGDVPSMMAGVPHPEGV